MGDVNAKPAHKTTNNVVNCKVESETVKFNNPTKKPTPINSKSLLDFDINPNLENSKRPPDPDMNPEPETSSILNSPILEISNNPIGSNILERSNILDLPILEISNNPIGSDSNPENSISLGLDTNQEKSDGYQTGIEIVSGTKPKMPKNPFAALKSDTNILLLGEVGVGKSAFVNSLPNYIKYNSLGTAVSSQLMCAVPIEVTVNDGNEERVMRLPVADNDNPSESLQYPQTYTFPVKRINVSLIDTPEFTDDSEQIQKNMASILMYLTHFEKLDVICFVMKSNLTSVGKYFKFCMHYLLSHLGSSAGNNVIFILTDSASPIDEKIQAATILKEELEMLEGCTNLEVKFEPFYIDIDGFKFPSAIKAGINFDEELKKVHAESWKRSTKSSLSMLQYIGDHTKPLELQISVNNVRRSIIDIIKPLIDALVMVQYNIKVLNDHNKSILQDNLQPKALKLLMFIPQIIMKQTSLPEPAIVCIMPSCCESRSLWGIKKYIFSKKCQKVCYLRNVPDKLLGLDEFCCLLEDDDVCECKHCECSISMHMQILYDTDFLENTVDDKRTEFDIESDDDMILMQYMMVTKIQEYNLEYAKEISAILKAFAQFMLFLSNTTVSVSPFNDIFNNYLNCMICANFSDPDILKLYQATKALYEKKRIEINSEVSKENILKSIEALYELKYTGKNIRLLHKKQRTVRATEFLKTRKTYESKISNSSEEAKLRILNMYKERMKDMSEDHFQDLVTKYSKQQNSGKMAGKLETLQGPKLPAALPKSKTQNTTQKAKKKVETAKEAKKKVETVKEIKKKVETTKDAKKVENAKETKNKVYKTKPSDSKVASNQANVKQNNLQVDYQPKKVAAFIAPSTSNTNPMRVPNNFNQYPANQFKYIPNQTNNLPIIPNPNQFGEPYVNFPNINVHTQVDLKRLQNNCNQFSNPNQSAFDPNQYMNPNQFGEGYKFSPAKNVNPSNSTGTGCKPKAKKLNQPSAPIKKAQKPVDCDEKKNNVAKGSATKDSKKNTRKNKSANKQEAAASGIDMELIQRLLDSHMIDSKGTKKERGKKTEALLIMMTSSKNNE